MVILCGNIIRTHNDKVNIDFANRNGKSVATHLRKLLDNGLPIHSAKILQRWQKARVWGAVEQRTKDSWSSMLQELHIIGKSRRCWAGFDSIAGSDRHDFRPQENCLLTSHETSPRFGGVGKQGVGIYENGEFQHLGEKSVLFGVSYLLYKYHSDMFMVRFSRQQHVA